MTYFGLLDINWWQALLALLLLTHVTIISVTVYLHRCQAHRAVTLHPAVAHFFRFWLWLTTGMVTREWVAIHRRHHASCETPDDPHSPQVLGLDTVLWRGARRSVASGIGAPAEAGIGSVCPSIRRTPRAGRDRARPHAFCYRSLLNSSGEG